MLRMKVWIRENSNGQLEIINIDGDCRKKLSLINVDGKTFLSFENNSYVIIEDGQDIYFDGIEAVSYTHLTCIYVFIKL